jgi:hypothetical protein
MEFHLNLLWSRASRIKQMTGLTNRYDLPILYSFTIYELWETNTNIVQTKDKFRHTLSLSWCILNTYSVAYMAPTVTGPE